MTYSNEQIQAVLECAEALMKPSEIADIIEVDYETFKIDLADKETPVSKAYKKGKANTILNVKKQIVQLAIAGSPLAIQEVNDYLFEMNDEEIKW